MGDRRKVTLAIEIEAEPTELLGVVSGEYSKCAGWLTQQIGATVRQKVCPRCNGTGWREDVEVARTWRGVRS